MTTLRAPFPWFGGKSRAAHLVWPRFGDVPNYVEPFAGSLAVLLGRPTPPRIETANDIDTWLSNFWRAVQADPEGVARYADWPVNEADLHARHRWLVNQAEFRERMKHDPDYFDAKIAGWWVWGICQWIGSGWCSAPEWTGRTNAARRGRGGDTPSTEVRPHLGGQGLNAKRSRNMANASEWEKRSVLAHSNRGVNLVSEQVPMLRGDGGASGAGIHASGMKQQIPFLNRAGSGIHSGAAADMIREQLPDLGGNGGAAGKGVSASALTKKMPRMDRGTDSRLSQPGEAILTWMLALQDRLRRVRVCCGDWQRVLGRSATECIGVTGVFLDPPYGTAADRDPSIYTHDDLEVATAVREWAIANGDNSKLRIALCGYEGEHEMPPSWECVAWKANGGYAALAGNHENAKRERIWFSPHCLSEKRLF